MSIYYTIHEIIVDKIVQVTNFEQTRLYIKRILKDDNSYIYYIGKTSRQNIKKYSGSGTIWKKYIKKYGSSRIEHVWESEWYHNSYELQYQAIRFSIENDIVNSSYWANSKIENGISGGLLSDETKRKISEKLKGTKKNSIGGTFGMIWIHRESERKCIPKTQKIPNGWSKGYHIDTTKEKNSVYGKRMYNNGIISKYFESNEIIPAGWTKGRISKHH